MRDIWHKQLVKLSIDLFKVDVFIAVNMREAEIIRRFMTLPRVKPGIVEAVSREIADWDRDLGGNVEGRMCQIMGAYLVLLKLDRHAFRQSLAVLTHELVHVTQYVLRERRVPLTEDTEEVHAYMTEHLLDAAMQKLWTN